MTEEELEAVRIELARLGRDWTPHDVADALLRTGLVVSDAMVMLAVQQLKRGSVGAGPLQPLLERPGVTDVLVDGPHRVLIDQGKGLEQVDCHFDSDLQVRNLAVRLAASAGRRLDDAMPYVDARLSDGTRLHAVLAPIADPGTCISLRVPSSTSFSLDQWVSNGSMSAAMAAVLRAMISARVAFLISGGTGTGKTTLLASMLALVPAHDRIVIVEDSRELNPQHPQCVRMEARPRNAEGVGAITLTDLVRQALRMRPDRLVLGEVRGAELCDLLMALNTGHEGGCGTVHANSAQDVPARLEALAALGGMGRDACHAQVASALTADIHVVRGADGRRRVAQIGVFQRASDGLVSVIPAVNTSAGGGLVEGPGFALLETALNAGRTP